MKGRTITAAVSLSVLVCLAQNGSGGKETKPTRNLWIRGRVVNGINNTPLSRARVFLRSAGGETQNLAADSDEKGSFVLPNVAPGKYILSAQRDGFIDSASPYTGAVRLPAVVQVEEGGDLRDIVFRLKPWSVIAGRVRFNDAEPAIGALVQVYRDAWSKGRRGFRLVSYTRTNDRGEYRVAALQAGAYYVAATYDRPLSPEFQERDPVDEHGKRQPVYRFSTTFYPTARKLADAETVRVQSAQEIEGLDIFLEPVRTVSVRGRVLSGLTGQPVRNPNVMLRRLSADERSSINASITVIPRAGGFEIRGVAAGPYLLVADSTENGKRIFARTPLMVNDADIDQIELLLEPERTWNGSIVTEKAPNVTPGSMRLTLEPRSDLHPPVAVEVRKDGTFTVSVVKDETYDAYITGVPEDVFIQSIRTGGFEVGGSGIAGDMAAASVPLRIELSSRDGVAAGRVLNAAGAPAAGVSITVVPESLRGRAHLVKTGFADPYGQFQIRGLAPGSYTAFAYYEETPCEFYDAGAMSECQTLGTSFTVSEGSQTALSLRLPR